MNNSLHTIYISVILCLSIGIYITGKHRDMLHDFYVDAKADYNIMLNNFENPQEIEQLIKEIKEG